MTDVGQPRNILFFFTDQHRLDTLGCYGNTICQTPTIDALAATGTRFDQAYTPTAICTPARASLVTGVLPFRHALLANYERNVGYREELGDEFAPFSQPLREAGYSVGHLGKWHVGKHLGPAEFGFDGPHFPGWWNPIEHEDYQAYLRAHDYPPHRLSSEIRGTFPNSRPANLIAGVLDQPLEATFEYFLAERAIAQLREYAGEYRSSGTPFYLTCQWYGPHLPYLIPKEYIERYDPADVTLPASMAETFAGKPRVQQHYSAHWAFDSFTPDEWRALIAMYWGYVSLIDEQMGRIMAVVDELGLADETAVFFSADHGEFTGAHRLNDKGPAMYDDIYRVPLVARIPGTPAGLTDNRFVSLVDLTATFLDLAGVPVPEHYDGRSLVPLIAGQDVPDWRTAITAEFHGHHFPYPQRMIRTERYKLVVNPADLNELYDLAADPHELRNRYDHPELVGEQRELMSRLYQTLLARGDNFHHWMATMYDVGLGAESSGFTPV